MYSRMVAKRSSVSQLCATCGRPFFPWTGRPSSNFCSLKCNGERAKNKESDAIRRLAEEVIDRDGCLIWTGAKSQLGYGVLNLNGSAKKAHRIAYELSKGPIPKGAVVCHACDTPACVNPDHLWLAPSNAANVADMDQKGRRKNPAPMRGQAHPLHKLSIEKARAIKFGANSIAETARQYGVSPSLVSGIRRGTHWPDA